jgi:plasmid stabilization system protein ParE
MLELAAHCSHTGLLPKIRIVPVGSHVIFYLQDSDFLRIAQVLHGSRDLELQFSDTDEP